jgi:hypothetical protein
MERNSTNENIEHFLRQNAEEFKMHPSPKVWDSISKNLNKRKRRFFYFGLITLLVTSSVLGYTLLDFSFFRIGNNTNTTTPSEAPLTAPSANAGNRVTALNKKNTIENSSLRKTASAKPDNNFNLSEITNPIGTAFNADLSRQRQNGVADLIDNTPIGFDKTLSDHKKIFDFSSLNKITEEDNNITAKTHKKPKKFSLMFYFTPTVSYRKLSENKSYLRSASLIGVPYNYAALYDVNSAVTHKPNIGLEFGLTTKYALTKNIKLRAGVQFNINRYDIKAFKYTPEVATIALNNGASGVQYVSAGSNYRNFNGGQMDWLQNFYFQVSAPIGAEVKLHGNDKMYIGAASTIQPTYVLGDRAYLITTDYKNYAQVPWLMRRWNVNTNLETFVAYSTGKLKWQVGPQVRYQLLSSFVNKYPVKENLFDFGLKVGISVNQNQ